ncbi:guanine nucleotide exchange factor synembryn-domain-containing protein [Leucosporidium creatinivorum]|uniref:Guanine nucleotide exchange factor synembryn-domain-containing protein n=1 Tax=Leucosporidium creatinivorum TaxID=106004 RepID=A0A1Y2G3W3_9BASI|nr:guanine nucleotide exchange factor synembryn-domain-containing protein [Leucosporidium creatinivorum]
MADPWAAYLGLSAQEQEKPTVLPVLQKLLQTLQAGAEPAPETRRRLLSALLSSLSSTFLNITADPALLAPLASLLKFLGRSPAGSEELGRGSALKVLLTLGGLARAATLAPAPTTTLSRAAGADDEEDDEEQEGIEALEKDLLRTYESEALRCLCNVLTLHPSARDLFPEVLAEEPDRLALKGMVRLMGCEGAGFLAGRLLFLLTSKPGELISVLAEGEDTVKAMELYTLRYINTLRDSATAASLTSGPVPSPADTLREHLKLAYNLMLQYGRQPPPPTPTSPPATESATVVEIASTDSVDKSETDDESDDSEKATPREEELDASPKAAQTKKKRFWSSLSKGSGETLDTATPPGDGSSNSLPSASNFDPTSDPSPPPIPLERRRSKSPRFYARKIVDAVTGSPSSSRNSTPATSPNLPSSTSLPKRSPAIVNASEGNNSGTLTLTNVTPFLPLFQPYLTLSCLLPLGDDLKDPSPLLRGALNTLLNYPVELEELNGFDHSWLQPIDGSQRIIDTKCYATRRNAPRLPPIVARLMEVLSKTCDAWFPVDVVPAGQSAAMKKKVAAGASATPAHPDELIPKGLGESTRAEEILGPVMLLLRKISLLAEPAALLREILLPQDIDRSIPLERRPDLIGHLIRLLSSLLLPNTAYGVGEFLYNLCDRDPATLCTQIGYGNASGFLQNRGELIPPPPIANANTADSKKRKGSVAAQRPTSSTSTIAEEDSAPTFASPFGGGPSGPRAVNPITGAFGLPPDPDEVEMTEEEKEREAEKLYVLFDRMQRTGVMTAENPVKKGAAEGRFEETTEEREAERKKWEEEEERLEKEVEREMEIFRARKKAMADKAKAEAALQQQ